MHRNERLLIQVKNGAHEPARDSAIIDAMVSCGCSRCHRTSVGILCALSIIATLQLGPFAVSAADLIIGRASVVDGDTLEIRGRRVRLFAIDAPEIGQTCTDANGAVYRCGHKAAQVLDYRISDGIVTCESKDRNQYGRVEAVCRAHGEDLGAWMVGLGWAVAFRENNRRYVPAEELAKRRNAGIWAGSFELPSDRRLEHRPD
jgi:endonuclease YncB( thermonuclease family)